MKCSNGGITMQYLVSVSSISLENRSQSNSTGFFPCQYWVRETKHAIARRYKRQSRHMLRLSFLYAVARPTG